MHMLYMTEMTLPFLYSGQGRREKNRKSQVALSLLFHISGRDVASRAVARRTARPRVCVWSVGSRVYGPAADLGLGSTGRLENWVLGLRAGWRPGSRVYELELQTRFRALQ